MEQEKNKFRLSKYIWIIPLVIGLIVGFIGISKINAANNTHVPSMGQDGWFEAKSAQSTSRFEGISTCMIGFFVIGLMGTIMCYTIPRNLHKTKHHYQNIESIINSDLQQKTQPEKNEKLKKCIYCGSLCRIDSTECESCGGKEFKKHKQ